MFLQNAISKRMHDKNPVKVALIGAGKFGSMFLSQVPSTNGLEVSVIADLKPENAIKACKNVGCALIGGETSEMPGVFNESNFDISGFVVGAVEADQMLDPINTSKAGDLLIGLPSNGLHTNGYSLVRHVFNLPNDLDILEEKIIERSIELFFQLSAVIKPFLTSLIPIKYDILIPLNFL